MIFSLLMSKSRHSDHITKDISYNIYLKALTSVILNHSRFPFLSIINLVNKLSSLNCVQHNLMKYIGHERNSENVFMRVSVEWQKCHSAQIKDVDSHLRWCNERKEESNLQRKVRQILDSQNKFHSNYVFYFSSFTRMQLYYLLHV